MITSLVVAASRNDVIGRGESLPWYLPEDLRHFRELTAGHSVIMGRVTYDSILARLGHPLPDRTSIVVSSRQREGTGDVLWVKSLRSGIFSAREIEAKLENPEIFVIGGASIYRQALPSIDKIYLTRVHSEVEGDAFLPPGWLQGYTLIAQADHPRSGDDCIYSFLEFTRE